jgi:hypothetical protein
MFDLEARIRQWREDLVRRLGDRGDTAEELESHLRDELQRLALAGRSPEEAWTTAVAKLGDAGKLAAEFAKVPAGRPLRWAPAWIVVVTYFFVITGLVCPVIAHADERHWTALLTMHVVTVSIGYAATFAFGILTAWLALSRLWGGITTERVECLRWWGHQFARFAVVFCSIGFVLGAIFAKDNYGAYWENDPREIGGLVMTLWAIAAAIYFSRSRSSVRSDLLVGLVGNLILGLAWLVAGWIASRVSTRGLHSYGVSPAFFWSVMVYFALHLAFVALALVPIRTPHRMGSDGSA